MVYVSATTMNVSGFNTMYIFEWKTAESSFSSLTLIGIFYHFVKEKQIVKPFAFTTVGVAERSLI